MNRTRISRIACSSVLAAALTAFAAGCSGTSSSSGDSTGSSGSQKQGSGQAFPSGQATVRSSLGSMDIQTSAMDLQISGAELKPGPGGTSLLSATIRNTSGIPEHLAAVTAPDGRNATISQGGAKAGIVSTAGVLLAPGSSTSVGGSGQPVVRLPEPVGAGSSEKLMIEFAVTGLVHLEVRTAH
ncbi:hypothetical protein [Phaeacidiphilus oryzae]|uniref:hypothetical protein n=1 Tax=Phaeacidiphilus oryzae TaxID=348818 RepID=UPI001269DF83|nr:hypothetical protein [Phaeacidiphilus oryzae]